MITKLDIYCLYRPQVLISLVVPDSYACRDLSVDYVVPPMGADAILWCGQLGADMAGRELASPDVLVLAGGYWRGSDSCCARLRMLQVMSSVMLDSTEHAAGDAG